MTLSFIALEIDDEAVTYKELKDLSEPMQNLICEGFSLVDKLSKYLSPTQQQDFKQKIAKCTTSEGIKTITSSLWSSATESFYQALEDLNNYSLGENDSLFNDQIENYKKQIEALVSQATDFNKPLDGLEDILIKINNLKSSVNSLDMQVLKNYLENLGTKSSIFHSSGQEKASEIFAKLKAVPLDQRKDILSFNANANAKDKDKVKEVQTAVSRERFMFSSKTPNDSQIKKKLGKLKEAQDKSNRSNPSSRKL